MRLLVCIFIVTIRVTTVIIAAIPHSTMVIHIRITSTNVIIIIRMLTIADLDIASIVITINAIANAFDYH